MSPSQEASAHRHLRLGWWTLLLFLTLGIVLESLHGFKVGWYLDVVNATRREMWRLAHAHGTFLALIHLAWAFTLSMGVVQGDGRLRAVSVCLNVSTLLVPGGFFLGGIVVYAGDPGLGVLLVPLGAVVLLVGVGLAAMSLGPRTQ